MRRALAGAAVLLAAAACGGDGGRGSVPATTRSRPTTTVAPATTTAATATTVARPGAAGYDPPQLLAVLEDRAVRESSGLAASRRNQGRFWTHNDSGDSARLFCFDRAGASCGTWPVGAASNRDWEDMAAGPGPEGEPSLFVGDIGDNDRARDRVTVHVVPEPEVGPDAAPLTARTVALTYPDGPHDAEALLVHPVSGDLYVVTKELAGDAGVYKAAAPLPLGGGAALAAVARLRVPGLITGGDIAPDGGRVVLCTYADGFELTLPAGRPFDEVWAQPPAPVTLGARRQGEAIAYRLDGAALLTTSEGVPAPIHEVARRT